MGRVGIEMHQVGPCIAWAEATSRDLLIGNQGRGTRGEAVTNLAIIRPW